MLCSYFIKVAELLIGSAPGSDGGFIIIKVGLVPYFPIFYIVFISVCPAVIIVTDNMLAYYCPFFTAFIALNFPYVFSKLNLIFSIFFSFPGSRQRYYIIGIIICKHIYNFFNYSYMPEGGNP
jgi:hypothetical protein